MEGKDTVPRNLGTSEARTCPQLSANKETEISVLQPRELNSANSTKEQGNSPSLVPTERKAVLQTLDFRSVSDFFFLTSSVSFLYRV